MLGSARASGRNSLHGAKIFTAIQTEDYLKTSQYEEIPPNSATTSRSDGIRPTPRINTNHSKHRIAARWKQGIFWRNSTAAIVSKIYLRFVILALHKKRNCLAPGAVRPKMPLDCELVLRRSDLLESVCPDSSRRPRTLKSGLGGLGEPLLVRQQRDADQHLQRHSLAIELSWLEAPMS